MEVLITGASSGIGKAIALKFLKEKHEVHGIDILPSSIVDKNYKHYICDIINCLILRSIRERRSPCRKKTKKCFQSYLRIFTTSDGQS